MSPILTMMLSILHMKRKSRRKKPMLKPKKLDDSCFKWRRRDLIAPAGTTFDLEFSEPPGEEIDDLPSPKEYFSKFIGDDFMGLLAEESNKYSGNELNTTAAEMRKFVGILLFMGATGLGSYRAYWSTYTRLGQVADCMPLKRFEKLKRHFHIADNALPSIVNSVDKLRKVRPLLDHFLENCRKIEPEERQSIDEMMIPFKGRSSLKQYMKNKPHKWGIKVFSRCGQTGIIYDFMVYEAFTPSAPDGFDYYGLGGNIVLLLSQPLFNTQPHKLYMDNFFTSFELVQELSKQGLLCVGTVNQSRLRGCPLQTEKELKHEGRGAMSWAQDVNSGVFVIRWMDNRAVQLSSNYVGVEPQATQRRWDGKAKKHIDVPSPAIVSEYNANMGGVDLSDMLASFYRINHRSSKMYMKIVFWCLSAATTNAWNLYRRHGKQIDPKAKLMPLYQFQMEMSRSLMYADYAESNNAPAKRPRLSKSPASTPPANRPRPTFKAVLPTADVRLDRVNHFPAHGGKEKRGICRKCKATTQIYCTKCSQPGCVSHFLCLRPERNCFSGSCCMELHRIERRTVPKRPSRLTPS